MRLIEKHNRIWVAKGKCRHREIDSVFHNVRGFLVLVPSRFYAPNASAARLIVNAFFQIISQLILSPHNVALARQWHNVPVPLLPPNATPQERALSLATARVLDVPTAPVRKLWSPWECPADVLPWLAWSLAVEPWRSEWPEHRKRAAIAASISTHRIKGTVGAVRRALAMLGFDVEFDEESESFRHHQQAVGARTS